MRFSFGLVALIGASANAAIDAASLTTGLGELTTLTNDVIAKANSLTTTNVLPVLGGISAATVSWWPILARWHF